MNADEATRARMRAAAKQEEDRLAAWGWRSHHSTRPVHRDGIEVQGVENDDGGYRDNATTLRIHECPRCGGAVLDRDTHMEWHDGQRER